TPGEEEWIFLTNLAHSPSNRYQPDDIDQLLLGPQGLFVIEVKHWDRLWMKNNRDRVDHEADKLTDKVRRVATNARRRFGALGHVPGRILLTAEQKPWGSAERRQRG